MAFPLFACKYWPYESCLQVILTQLICIKGYAVFRLFHIYHFQIVPIKNTKVFCVYTKCPIEEIRLFEFLANWAVLLAWVGKLHSSFRFGFSLSSSYGMDIIKHYYNAGGGGTQSILKCFAHKIEDVRLEVGDSLSQSIIQLRICLSQATLTNTRLPTVLTWVFYHDMRYVPDSKNLSLWKSYYAWTSCGLDHCTSDSQQHAVPLAAGTTIDSS